MKKFFKKTLVLEYDSNLSKKHSNEVTNKNKEIDLGLYKKPNKPTRSLQTNSGGSEE